VLEENGGGGGGSKVDIKAAFWGAVSLGRGVKSPNGGNMINPNRRLIFIIYLSENWHYKNQSFYLFTAYLI